MRKYLSISISIGIAGAFLSLGLTGLAAAMPASSMPSSASSSAIPTAKPLYPVYHPGEKLYPVKHKPVVKADKSVKTDKKTAHKPGRMAFIVPNKKNKPKIVFPKTPAIKLAIKPVIIHVKKGITRIVELSLTQINRIIINSYIKSVKTNKTGNLSVLLQGRNAFVEWTPLLEKQGNVSKIDYDKSVNSVIFDTNKGIFTLVLIPKHIPAQTVYIKQGNGFSRTRGKKFYRISKKGIGNFLSGIYKNVYNGVAPRGFALRKKDTLYNAEDGRIKALLVKVYKGGSLEVFEFHIFNETNKKISLSNKNFINLLNGPLSISLSHEHLLPDTFTRLFIVKRGGVR